MAIMPRGDKQRVDFLLREQLGGACGCLGEAELLSVVNGICAVCCGNGVQLRPGFDQRGNQYSPTIIACPNASYNRLRGYA